MSIVYYPIRTYIFIILYFMDRDLLAFYYPIFAIIIYKYCLLNRILFFSLDFNLECFYHFYFIIYFKFFFTEKYFFIVYKDVFNFFALMRFITILYHFESEKIQNSPIIIAFYLLLIVFLLSNFCELLINIICLTKLFFSFSILSSKIFYG